MKNENILLAILGGLALLKVSRGSGIGAIMDEAPARGGSQCLDGKFSTFGPRHPGGVCSYHGGRGVARQRQPEKNCSISFDEFRKQRAHRLATQAKEETKKALKNSGGSYTSTWYKAELRRAYNFNYDYYRFSEDKKYPLAEYEAFCKAENARPVIGAIFFEIPRRFYAM